MSRESDEIGAEQHYAQFDPDPATGEPDVFDDAYLQQANAHTAAHIGDPLDLDGWDEEMDERLRQVNLPARVAGSATAGRR